MPGNNQGFLSSSCNRSCTGGNPDTVIELAKSVGLVPDECAPYLPFFNYGNQVMKEDTSKGEDSSSASTDVTEKLNDYIEKKYPCVSIAQSNCSMNVKQSPCYPAIQSGKTFKIKEHYHLGITQDTVNTYMQTLDNIRTEIYKNGPVVSSYLVYADFMFLRSPEYLNSVLKSVLTPDNLKKVSDWNVTNGVYIHGFYDKYLVNKNTNQPITVSSPDGYLSLGHAILGGHAIEIVGWGETNIMMNEKKVNVPYWVVKNSWGTVWAENGYFKIGMYNPNIDTYGTPLNQELGLDYIIEEQGGSAGGILAPHIDDSVLPTGFLMKKKETKVLMWVGIIVLILAVVGVVLYMKHKHKHY